MLALIAMMDHDTQYTNAEVESQTPTLKSGDVMAVETRREREEAMKIIRKLKKGLKVKDAAAELLKSAWWEPGPICDLRAILKV